jgi:hypothetical protein
MHRVENGRGKESATDDLIYVNKNYRKWLVLKQICLIIWTDFYPSFPSSLPSHFLACCAILPTSFGGKGQLSSGDLAEIPLSRKVKSWRSGHIPRFHLITALIITQQSRSYARKRILEKWIVEYLKKTRSSNSNSKNVNINY